MQIFKTRHQLIPYLIKLKEEGNSIGFIPTMGALHKGHLSLINRCNSENSISVCSIFVNPTQFTDTNDLAKYPRPIQEDIIKLESAECDILYLPEADDIYPDGTKKTEDFDFSGLENKLEGVSRPGHFAGVAQVVKVLLEIMQPDKLYLGQKDYQQFLILYKLVEILKFPTEVVMCPIFREQNGLAMSSRNERLNVDLRKKAGIINATLNYSATILNEFSIDEIKHIAITFLNSNDDFIVDYFEILNAENLENISPNATPEKTIIIVSVIVGGVRLLDNLIINNN